MNDAACVALQELIRRYGPGIHQVPRSCELLIQQACGTFQQESKLLIEALRDGVPDDLNQYCPEEESWEAVAEALSHRLSRRGMPANEGRWAVETWARALSRHPENFAETQTDAWASPTPADGHTVADGADRILRLLVASGGGAFGGFLGAAVVPTWILLNEVAMRVPYVLTVKRAFSMREIGVAAVFVCLLFAIGGALFGAMGAALGWINASGRRARYAVFLSSGVGAFLVSLIGASIADIVGSSVGAFLGALGTSLFWARSGRSD